MQFIFQYPVWFVAFCLVLGAIYSLVLYFKTKHFSDETKGFHWIKKLMAILRFLNISLLSFLLLSPLIKTRFIDKIQPTIIIAHDNSSSVKLSFKNVDSTKYIADLKQLHQDFSKKYALDYYSFSNELNKIDTLNFAGKKTNISKILSQLNGNYYNRNVGALILATDGIYNEGQNPVYTDFNFPIYAIALGDTSQQKDLKISNVRANKIAYLNDKVKVNIDISSYHLKGKNFKVSVYKKYKGKSTLVQTRNLKNTKDYTEQSTSIIINANLIGIQRYTVVVSNIKDEITYENNSYDFYIDVIDSRQKILILANAPHPDIAVLKQTIALNKNLDLKIQFIKDFSENLADYNLIILHQLPSSKQNASNIFATIKKEKIPFWIFSGSQTDYRVFNEIQSIVNINPSADNMNEVIPFYNENFNIFTLNESTLVRLKRFPPVTVPFGSYKLSANTKNLFFQKIGAVDTDYPILSFSDNFGVKSAVFIGDDLWRWKMHDFLDNKNHDAFNEIFSKTINFLALKSDKRKFRVATPKNLFYEGEPVIIEAELYNESYELINSPEVSLNVKNEKGDIFPLVFNRTSNAYSIESKALPIGNYTYKATTSYAGKNYNADGAFSIKPLQIEALQTKANHKMLYKLVNKTGGKVFYPNEIDKLKDFILQKKDIKPTLYESFKTRSIINLKWIFFLILALLSLEWFARKFYGGY